MRFFATPFSFLIFEDELNVFSGELFALMETILEEDGAALL